MDILRSVWIDECCIVCYACETSVPTVFRTEHGTTMILGGAREDGLTSPNAERSPLTASGLAESEAIREAAAGCPVEAIRLAQA